MVDKRQYRNALAILDTIDTRKVKITTDLTTFVEVYMNTERYEDAKEILLRLYTKSPTRRIVYQLLIVAINTNDIDVAEQYYEEYRKMAPDDPELYVMRYLIEKEKGTNRDSLIKILEQLKKISYMEEWAYELAKLYHKAGRREDCLKECSDIVLWFGQGVIVEKARMLRDHYLGTATIPIEEIQEAIKKQKKGGIQEKEVFVKEVEKVVKELHTNENKQQKQAIFQNNSLDIKTELPLSSTKEPEIESESIQNSKDKTILEKPVEEAEKPMKKKVEDFHTKKLAVERLKQTVKTERAGIDDTGNWNAESIEEKREKLETTGPVMTIMGESKTAVGNMDFSKLFGGFSKVSRICDQIESLLMVVEQEDLPRHLLVVGQSKSGKTTLSKMIAKMYYKIGLIKTPQVARITAQRLNMISIEDKKEKLKDGCLLVENASFLTRNTILQLVTMMQEFGENIIVILEDRPEIMELLMQEYPGFSSWFGFQITIPAYTREDLLGFSIYYIESYHFILTQDGKMALEQTIDKILTECEERAIFIVLLRELQNLKERVEARSMMELIEKSKKGIEPTQNTIIIDKKDFSLYYEIN